MKNFNPYLTFGGSCREAMEFYKTALNGELISIQTFEEAKMEVPDAYKKQIIHAELKAEGVHLMASDGMVGWVAVPGNNVTLSIDFTDGEEQEKVWNALSAGGKVTMPMESTFWGARFGMFTDRFGIQWMLNFQKPQSSM